MRLNGKAPAGGEEPDDPPAGAAGDDADDQAAIEITDAELARVVDAWPALPAAIKRAIEALIDSTEKG